MRRTVADCETQACRTQARTLATSSRSSCRSFSSDCKSCCQGGGADCFSGCGNGVIDGLTEQCDPPGPACSGGGACDAACRCPTATTTSVPTTSTTRPPPRCGDGWRDLPEGCDDGNAVTGDGCEPDCTASPCPAGIADPHTGCATAGDACTVLPPACAAAPLACTISGDEVSDVIAYLADDAQQGRDNLSPASIRVQDFLIERLSQFSIGAAGGGGFRAPFASGTNLLARIPGADPNTTETVVVGAHYDHLGAGGVIYNGATDNAGGTAAVLAIGRALSRLPTPPKRSIVLALWDAEEDGLVGSIAYVGAPAVPLADTIAYLNLDIVGSTPVQGFRRETFLTGIDTSSAFPPLLDGVLEGDPLGVGTLSALFGQGRSDYAPFLAAGIPTLFFSDTTGGCYHTPGDDLATVHMGKVLRTSWLGFRIALALADGGQRPGFQTPEGLPTFHDGVVLRDVLNRGLCNALSSGLQPSDVTNIGRWLTELDGIIQRGAVPFSTNDAVAVGLRALDAIALLSSLPCQPN
jgi:cysteine-rich repeat protein